MEVLWIFLILLAVAAVAGLVSSWVSGQKRLRRRVLDQFGKLPAGDASLEGVTPGMLPNWGTFLWTAPPGRTWIWTGCSAG